MSQSPTTLASSVRLEGVGLHSGKACAVTLSPAEEGSGICFYRSGKLLADLRTEASRATLSLVHRCSAVGPDHDPVQTVEHLLAAIAGMGLTNVRIDVEGPEIPAADGSARPFVEAMAKAGLREQPGVRSVYSVREPIFCYDKGRAIGILPAEGWSVSYTLDYDHSELRDCRVEFDMTKGSFAKEIASARTFCTDKEAEELQQKGFGLGADETNTVVVRSDGSHRSGLRFPDECARHKILDIIGDLAILGFPINGRIIAIRSGHALNRRLAGEILKQKATA